MSEELQNALEQFLMKLIQGVEKVGDFAVDQVPQVIQEALLWFAVKSGVSFGFGLLLVAVSVWLIFFAGKNLYQRNKDGSIVTWRHDHSPKYKDSSVMCLITSVFGIVIGFIFMVCNLEWLQILIAPKWFIVSEMSKLI